MNQSLLRASLEEAAVFSFCRSGGAGGQNVNKVNSKVELRLPLDKLAGLRAEEAERLRSVLASRLDADGALLLFCDEERSQARNRERVMERAFALIAASAHLAPRRRPTRPGRASREERLRAKKARSRCKVDRRPPTE